MTTRRGRSVQYAGVWAAALAVLLLGTGQTKAGDPTVYEPLTDPGVGFNLISWFNFGASGASVWTNAVQDLYDSGFDEVSISPVRFFNQSTGAIATSSSQGPELSHIAAGISHAKSLGMTVTVNPFVEPENFATWRGFWNPAPGSGVANTFWNDYDQYLVDVAQVAEANGADYLNVGTELRNLSGNSGHNADWTDMINQVDANFSGELGYAANWDNYNNSNVTSTIWEHPAIDYMGIDSYFTGTVTNGQADASGSNPNPTFIGQVEAGWNSRLDNTILPFADARKSGNGMPVVFTEVGYLPYNRTAVTPQNSSGSLDQDEQTMTFDGLLRALDGRLIGDDFRAIHIWQWGMPGSNGSLWNMNLQNANQPNNTQTAQFLSDFVGTADPPGPGDETLLYSWETGLEDWTFTSFYSTPTRPSVLNSSNGATEGSQSLQIVQNGEGGFSWNAIVEVTSGDEPAIYAALSDAAANPGSFSIAFDVTVDHNLIDDEVTLLNIPFAIQSDAGFGQVNAAVSTNGQVSTTLNAVIPLTSFNIVPTSGSSFYNLIFGMDGDWTSGNTAVFFDNLRLIQTGVIAQPGDADGDGDVDLDDFNILASNFGGATGNGAADGDFDGDGDVDLDDFNILASAFGTGVPENVAGLPEPGSFAVFALGLAGLRRTRRSAIAR